MKSKLFSMMSVMVIALTLATAANAQDRPDSGTIQPFVKVDLPCTIDGIVTSTKKMDNGIQVEVKLLSLRITNNTGFWLGQGKVTQL